MPVRSLPAAANIDRLRSDAVAFGKGLMVRHFLTLSLTVCAALGLPMAPAAAQQTGGILKFFHRDSPASMSIHEEATISTVAPMMGVFNNLVLFKQDERQNRAEFIQPELAKAGRGMRTTPGLPSNCDRASNGTTASRSPPPMSNALGTC